MHNEDSAPAPSVGLDIIDQQRRSVSTSGIDSRLLYVVWALAWGIGYGALWLSGRDGEPGPVANATFGAAMVIGVVATTVHIARRTAGIRGTSSRAGAIYGVAWLVGFTMMGMLLGSLSARGASDEVIALAAIGVSSLIVGLLYLFGWALFGEPSMGLTGGWIMVIGTVATATPIPTAWLVMSVGTGLGYGAAAVASQLARRQA